MESPLQGGKAPSKSKMTQQHSPCQWGMPTLRLEGHPPDKGVVSSLFIDVLLILW